MTTYRISAITDLFAVPIDRREACVDELLTSLAFAELCFGEEASLALKEIAWTDDGGLDQSMQVNGEPFATLRITKDSE